MSEWPVLERYLSPRSLGISTKSNVLDVGCGTSDLVFHLSKLYEKVVGLDISTKVINAMKKRYEEVASGIEFIEASMTKNCPLESDRFDLVVDKATLDCILCHDAVDYLCQVHDVLRVGGIYVVVSFHGPELIIPLLRSPGMPFSLLKHVRVGADPHSEYSEGDEGCGTSSFSLQKLVVSPDSCRGIYRTLIGFLRPQISSSGPSTALEHSTDSSMNVSHRLAFLMVRLLLYNLQPASSCAPLQLPNCGARHILPATTISLPHSGSILKAPVFVYIARKSPNVTAMADREALRAHHMQVMGQHMQSDCHSFISAERQVAIQRSDLGKEPRPLRDAYETIFDATEKEDYDFDFFLEDLAAFDNGKYIRTGLMGAAEAICFLHEMQ